MTNIKKERYESLIKDLISNAISNDIYNPLIKLATVHYVKLSADISVAKIYISCYDKTKIDKILKKMNEAVGFFRTILAKNLDLRKVPTIIFLNDDSIDRIDEINAILESIKGNKNGK